MPRELSLDELLGEKFDIKSALFKLSRKELVKLINELASILHKDDLIDVLSGEVPFGVTIDAILDHADSELQKKIFGEPRTEEELKVPIRHWLRERGFETREEIPISGSIADVVGYKKEFMSTTLVAFELKCAKATKRDLDRGIRQLDDYLDGVDYAYFVVTPILLGKIGVKKLIDRLKKLRVGLLVANKERVIATILEPKSSKHIKKEEYKAVLDWF